MVMCSLHKYDLGEASAAHTEYCDTRALPSLNHSSHSGFQLRTAVNRHFLLVVCTRGGGQTGIIRVRKIKAMAARPSHRLNSMER